MDALRERIVAKAEGEDNYDSLIPKIGLGNVLTLARADFFEHRRYCKRNTASPIAVGFADEFDPAKLRVYYEEDIQLLQVLTHGGGVKVKDATTDSGHGVTVSKDRYS